MLGAVSTWAPTTFSRVEILPPLDKQLGELLYFALFLLTHL